MHFTGAPFLFLQRKQRGETCRGTAMEFVAVLKSSNFHNYFDPFRLVTFQNTPNEIRRVCDVMTSDRQIFQIFFHHSMISQR